MLTISTKMYQVCVLSTLRQRDLDPQTQQKAQTQHLPPALPQKDIGITWQDRVPNKDVLPQAGAPSVFALLSQRRLRWLGHASRMEDGRIPNRDIPHCELATGTRTAGSPTLHFQDICKRDLKPGNINPAGWEAVAADRSLETIGQGTQACKERREEHWDERVKTAEGSISTHRATHRIHLQQSLPIRNRTVQLQQALQLNH